MVEVRRTIHFCYGHRIKGHGGGCRHLHGHNAKIEVVCRGPLDDLGMVVDFQEIRRIVEGWIDGNWDHRMILQDGDPMIPILKEQGEPVYVIAEVPTAENLAAHLYRIASDGGLPVTSVRFWETPSSMAVYDGP